MTNREQQRRQEDRDFEEVRKAVAAQSTEWLRDALREIPHRKWIEIEKDSHVAAGVLAHRAADRLDALENALRELHSTVRGESPALLNEDLGGNGELDVRICGLLGL